MAIGDITIFDEALPAFFDGTHDLDTHVIKLAILDNTTTPAAGDTTPALGDYTQVGTGGSYVSGGTTLTVSLSETAGVLTVDFTNNPSWAQNAGNDTDAYWGLIYNDTDAGDAAIGYVDLAGPFNMATGTLTVTWHANGAFQVTKA